MGYSPILGRFLQRDPIGYTDGMNLYQFLLDNPINFVDPFGNETSGPPVFQQVSNVEQDNFQTFSIQCSKGYIVSNVRPDYSAMSGAILLAGGNVHDTLAAIDGIWGKLRTGVTIKANCDGHPVIVETDMRSRLVGTSLLAEIYRRLHGLLDGATLEDIYSKNTVLIYQCLLCPCTPT
jgi:hypothetical protein